MSGLTDPQVKVLYHMAAAGICIIAAMAVYWWGERSKDPYADRAAVLLMAILAGMAVGCFATMGF